MQEDVLVAFGETVLPQMLALNYPAACDVLGNTPSPTANPTTGSPTTGSPTTGSQTTSSPTVFSGVCSDDGVTSCTATDISQCACASRRNLLEVKNEKATKTEQLRGTAAFHKHTKQQQERFVSRMLAKPTCTDGTCRKACTDCCPGGDCAAYEVSCGTCTTLSPTAAVTPSPVCKCGPTPQPVTPNPTSGPTNSCRAAGESCTDSSVNCCGGCSGGKPANRVCE